MRDFYGAGRSRWGWWSRFHRLKAASLVPAKRCCSVGDSTWWSQNTTLFLPATEWRKKVAHGVSRGFNRQTNQAAERRKKKTGVLFLSLQARQMAL